MKLRSFLKEHGQTAIEFVLVLAVSVSIGVAFSKKFHALMFDNEDSYIKTQLKLLDSMFDPQHGYKKFRLPR